MRCSYKTDCLGLISCLSVYAFMLNVVAGIIGRLELQENNALELAKLSECGFFLATNTGQMINVDNSCGWVAGEQ